MITIFACLVSILAPGSAISRRSSSASSFKEYSNAYCTNVRYIQIKVRQRSVTQHTSELPSYPRTIVTRRVNPFFIAEYTGSCLLAVRLNWKGKPSVLPKGSKNPLQKKKCAFRSIAGNSLVSINGSTIMSVHTWGLRLLVIAEVGSAAAALVHLEVFSAGQNC